MYRQLPRLKHMIGSNHVLGACECADSISMFLRESFSDSFASFFCHIVWDCGWGCLVVDRDPSWNETVPSALARDRFFVHFCFCKLM